MAHTFPELVRGVGVGGTLHAQGFMRPFAIEFADKIVELCLLLQAVRAGRAGGLLLEREMHALMASILLRVSRLDALDLNAEPEPPDRKLREVE